MHKAVICQFVKTTPKAIQYQQVILAASRLSEMVMDSCLVTSTYVRPQLGGKFLNGSP